jgi:hypothetical protein
MTYKPTKDEIFSTERYTIVEIPYGVNFLLPAKEATVLISQLQKAEAVDSNFYADAVEFKLTQPIQIQSKTVSKAQYQKAKIEALLLLHNPPEEKEDETDK